MVKNHRETVQTRLRSLCFEIRYKGTANGSDFLVDSTGNRCYWIVPVANEKIDIKRLKEERDRIWSAAVKAYRNGEQWWLTDEEEKLSQQNNQQFQIIDEWQGAIALLWSESNRSSASS